MGAVGVRRAAPLLLLGACAGRPAASPPAREPAPASPAPVATAAADSTQVVPWSSLQAEFEALICVWTFVAQTGEATELPTYGDRERCGLPEAQTPVERAVAATFADANAVLISLRPEKKAAFAAIELPDAEVRLRAVRDAYLSEAFVDVLLRRLPGALEAEGLRCDDCPAPSSPPRREMVWSGFQPYLAAHVWPDPVVTPRDAKGRPSGEPQISAHICGGINGVAELAEPEPVLVMAGFLAAAHTDAVGERALQVLTAMIEEPEYLALTTDDARTQHLRRQVAVRLLEDPRVATGVCATLRRFEQDTGVVITDCPR